MLLLVNIVLSLSCWFACFQFQRDGWYSGKVPTTARTNNANGSVPAAPRQEATLTSTPAFASGLTLLEPTCLVPDVKVANPDTSPGDTLQPSIGKDEKNKDTLSKPKGKFGAIYLPRDHGSLTAYWLVSFDCFCYRQHLDS